MPALGIETLDGRNGVGNVADRRDASAHGLPTDMDGTSTARGDAAAEFSAGQSDHVADDPEQRRIGRNIHLMPLSIHGECNRHGASPFCYSSCPEQKVSVPVSGSFKSTRGYRHCLAVPAAPPAVSLLVSGLAIVCARSRCCLSAGSCAVAKARSCSSLLTAAWAS